ncbi:MAG: 4-alpha-glucanotransferase [Sediminibacterium sp.]|nr:4-alpha-glucanotransferase [Sediminibacterium sp.]
MPTDKTSTPRQETAETKPVAHKNGKKGAAGKVTVLKNGHTAPENAPISPKTPARKATAAGKKAGTAAGTNKKTVAATGTNKSPAKKKAAPKTTTRRGLQKIIFQVRFHTSFGQQLFILGNHPLLGNGQVDNAVPLQYFDDEHWYLVIDLKETMLPDAGITYNYLLQNADGIVNYDWGTDKIFNPARTNAEELMILDSWNYAGYYENSFYTEPFANVLLKGNHTAVATTLLKKITHTLSVKSPLLSKGQTLCVLGSCASLGNWNAAAPVMLARKENEDAYKVSLDLSAESFPIAYKYGVYDVDAKQFIRFEDGNNRVMHDAGKTKRQALLNDGFAALPNDTWKGAGMAIPVFSLRSEQGFGIGEFTDLPLLVDWAKKAGLKMIQVLPINDTTATHEWTDSYPYAAISAFALHPIYLNLAKLTGTTGNKRLKQLEKERLRLNALPVVDYVAVAKIKSDYVAEVYRTDGASILAGSDFLSYFDNNQHWLVPYAAFCYLRDQYGTVDFTKWPAYKVFNAEEIGALTAKGSSAYTDVALHYFIQYHLHLQLKEATAYAHANGVIVKGDIAIGVYRHGADAWQDPELYHLDMQAGAPPDDFAVKGQNWGFPTYNWQRMREDGFAWWKRRFEQMDYYFDAFRIDHILGFFRIWSIPMDAVEGIMGHFVPAIPVHINEFNSKAIWFDHYRYTKPYITENVLWEVFGYDNELVKSMFLTYDGFGNYMLKPAFSTQRLIEAHFDTLEQDDQHAKIRQGLYDLVSNVILFEAEEGQGQEFHFRFAMDSTSSFRSLEEGTRGQLQQLYVQYFFRRQDDFWMKEALQKLPALKRVTNMLVCGEDLGLVPACVPDVMRQLGLLSLEIQRMPKNPATEFFHPNDAPYLSVVTPSTHDMSTIRGWWEEDRERIQRFYNHELGQSGEAPYHCEAWINKAIVIQHLYSPAMWSVFQLQDLLGMDETLRRENPEEERINIPADPKHYWQYRMHLTLESLVQSDAYNEELKNYIQASGR